MTLRQENVYIVQREDGLVKVGYSATLETRLTHLEKSHGKLRRVRILNGTRQRERSIHTMLKQHHEYGEWFRPSGELFSIVEGLEVGAPVLKQTDPKRISENDIAAKAGVEMAEAARKLLEICYKQTHQSSDEAFKRAHRASGIPVRALRRIMNRESAEPSYADLKRLRAGYISECENMLSYLKKEVEAELSIDPKDIEAIAVNGKVLALRQQLQAKKEQAR